jgi:hypothetical protein
MGHRSVPAMSGNFREAVFQIHPGSRHIAKGNDVTPISPAAM